MNGLEHGTRNRLRLWLRAEKAFGLTAVRSPPGQELVPRQTEPSVGSASILFPPIQQEVQIMAEAPLLIAPPAEAGFARAPLPREQKIIRLKEMDENEVRVCSKCRLCESRRQTVFGEGEGDAQIFFIGEGPGETEDQTGRPFVGRAGQLLDKMIAGMGLRRQQVYIANIVKCRPPANREPAPDEVATCTPYLERQLEIVRPRVIVTLGRPAATYMLSCKLSMGRLRGQWQSWRGIKLMPTFHPSYVLRCYTEQVRAAVWDDLKKVLVELGMPIPKKGGT